jgi:aldehyde dehydrogenase (NAD+)
MLNRLADALQARAADTNQLCTRENGMPIRLSGGANGVFPATLLGHYADMIANADDEEIRPSMIGPEGLAAYQTLKSIYRVGPSH